MADPQSTPRKPISVRTRFEIFKRDEFTCRYCGRRSPEVVLEIDHITPVVMGGGDDPINLLTACWECNRGKAGVPLSEVMTGEDPHDKAIEIFERERQLNEYNRVLAEERERIDSDAWELWRYWQVENGKTADKDLNTAPRQDINWLLSAVRYCPKEQIRNFMDMAQGANAWKNLKYVGACVRNWRYERQAIKDTSGDPEY